MTSNNENMVTIEEVIQQLQAGTSMPQELMEIYSEEADDHLRTIYDGLNRLNKTSDDMAALADVRRASHTLKGAAGAVNLQAVTRLAHRMEDLLDQLAELQLGLTPDQLELLLTTADRLQDLTSVEFDIQENAEQIVQLYQRFSAEMNDDPVTQNDAAPSVQSAGNSTSEPESTIAENATATVLSTPKKQDAAGAAKQHLRVPVDRLDDLVGLLGEMMVNRSEFQQKLDDFESRIEDMHNALERLRNVAQHVEVQQTAHEQTRQNLTVETQHRFDANSGNNLSGPVADFDPLEFEQYDDSYLLAQSVSEADNDAQLMSGEFRKVKSAFDVLLRRQQQLTSEAQNSLMRIRMVPLSGIVSRLERTVRTVASKVGRNVALDVVGERIELDKSILDEITDPLLHLIRNAIDHGIENADDRAAAGKPEVARLRLEAANQGTQITLRISDDGAGINLEKIRAKGIQQGLITEQQQLTNHELHALIFRPGFSTAATLTDVSGRGVGMDVVGDAIRRLKGTIRVESEPGQGTTFTIQLPTSVGSTRAIMVESAGQRFAIPLTAISRILKLNVDSVIWTDDEPKTRLADRDVQLVDLAGHLGLHPSDAASRFSDPSPLLILGIDASQIAITVDSILGSRDIVVKKLGDHLKRVRGFMGATIDGDGSVIPILDTTDLVERNSTDFSDLVGQYESDVSTARRNIAMVIDDSISVRRVTENTLQNAGWDVVTAKDGVDALEKLAELDAVPDVFLCDMEMPRMNGIELIRQIREQPEFELTPIVMVTSRATEKHRHKAYQAGATDYVVKPFNEEQLLQLIASLVDSAREIVSA